MKTFFKKKDLIGMGLLMGKPLAQAKEDAKKVMGKYGSIAAHTKKVWTWASRYFRKLDAMTRGDGERVKCVTCSKVLPWKELQAGHFIHGHAKPTYFLKENVHCQCEGCNYYNSEAKHEYTLFMIDTYGRKKVDELMSLSTKKGELDHMKLEELKSHFKEQFEIIHNRETHVIF